MESLIKADQIWLLWAAITAIAAFGLWAETTAIGLRISAAVVTILSGLILSNTGVIPTRATVYDAIWTYVLPLSIPLLLYQADIKRIVRQAGKPLLGFLCGTLGTLAGAVAGFFILPLGDRAAELAGAFAAAYIGGSLNFVATAKAVNLDSGDLIAAGIAAANLLASIYLVTLFLLPNITPLKNWLNRGDTNPRPAATEAGRAPAVVADPLSMTYALAISAAICALGYGIEKAVRWPGLAILSITLISVALATLFPAFFRKLQVGGQLGIVLLQFFFAAIGASASVHAVIAFGPTLLYLAGLVLITHFTFVLIGARLMSLNLYEMLIASNACAGGAPTAAAMAVSMRRTELILPAILCGTLGYGAGNFLGLFTANLLR